MCDPFLFAMRRFDLLSLIVLSSVLQGCQSGRENIRSADHSDAAADVLSHFQLKELTRRAQLGDGEAAERIATYFLFFKADDVEALRWYDLAAANGNLHARKIAEELKRETKECD
jgi:TPR repeat protein